MGYIPSVEAQLDNALGTVANLRTRIAELEAALRDAIEGWEDGANYKGDYLKEKHGDAKGIAKARAVLSEL